MGERDREAGLPWRFQPSEEPFRRFDFFGEMDFEQRSQVVSCSWPVPGDNGLSELAGVLSSGLVPYAQLRLQFDFSISMNACEGGSRFGWGKTA